VNEKAKAPLHAFELKISVGANTKEYLERALEEILQRIKRGNLGNAMSGGWDGSYAVTIAERDITPDAYRSELEEWRQTSCSGS
jgi:hypothetical protein